MNHQAIRNLYPTVVVIQDDVGCFDSEGMAVDIDLAAVESESDRLRQQARLVEYRRLRAPEYPSLQDFADAMYWHRKGDDTKLDAYVAACDAVKAQYPKGE